jgi:DNA-binding response OmpR family regulator
VGAGFSAAAVPSWARIAERLLMEMRAQDLRAPVIMFASGGHAEENRRTALNMGAQAYTFEWPTLFREIERVLRPVGADS